MVHVTVCSYHAVYMFQSESTLYSCLNVKEFLARGRHKIWSLSDCNWTWTQNHLVRKQTLNHLAKLDKWLSVNLRTKWFWVRFQLQSCDIIVSLYPILVVYFPDKYVTQRICVIKLLMFLYQHWNLFLPGLLLFFHEHSIDNTLCCNGMYIFSVNLKILIKLIVIIILIKMILILLFLSDFWFCIVNLKNAKHLKKDKWRINAILSVAS